MSADESEGDFDELSGTSIIIRPPFHQISDANRFNQSAGQRVAHGNDWPTHNKKHYCDVLNGLDIGRWPRDTCCVERCVSYFFPDNSLLCFDTISKITFTYIFTYSILFHSYTFPERVWSLINYLCVCAHSREQDDDDKRVY
jgi:hypothetical protein